MEQGKPGDNFGSVQPGTAGVKSGPSPFIAPRASDCIPAGGSGKGTRRSRLHLRELSRRAPKFPRLAVFLTLASTLFGCCQEHLRTYTLLDDQATLHQLAERGHRIHDVSATGSLGLSQKNGDSVRLTLAVALSPPDNARLRTWKFGQAVFDLTVIPQGSWLETPKDSSHAASIQSAGISAAQVARGWALLGGGFFDRSDLKTRNDGEKMIVTQANAGEPSIVCEVDRDTLAPRQYRLYDDTGKLRFHLELSEYQDFDGILWPRHIVATSDTGVIDVTLDDVTMNGGLPEAAFTPPRRAERLP